jgi:hypothetical protein
MWAYRICMVCLALSACIFTDDRDDDDRSEERDDGSDGGGSRPPRDQDTRPAPTGDFCDEWARAACTDAVVSACQASDEAECRQTQASFCRDLVPGELATAGRSACIAAVAAAYRDADLRGDELAVVLRFGGVCANTVVGASGEDDDCTSDYDCDIARGYSCVLKSDPGVGTCQIADVVDPGRDCRAAEKSCGEGFFCDGRNCVENLPVDESCVLHVQCGAEGFCDESGKCTERRAVNDSCQEDVECARGICAELADERVCTDRVVLSRADPLCANLR